MLWLPLGLYCAALLTVLAFVRRVIWPEGGHGWEVAELLFFALLAFGVGTCSFTVGWSPSDLWGAAESVRRPRCLLLATLGVVTLVASRGRPGRNPPRATVSTTIGLVAIVMIVAAFALLLAIQR